MNINERQFKQLQTMGVSLWQSRSGVFANVQAERTQADNSLDASDASLTAKKSEKTAEIATEKVAAKEEVKITFSDNLLKQSIVNDVAIALNVSITQISLNAFGLDLDGLSWQIGQSDICELEQNLLKTPAIEDFSNNAELKRALWLCLCQYLNSKAEETQ